MTTTANKAADDDSWKRKYRDSVRELDSRRTEWRESEARLQKSLLRIAFSFLGADAELDAELKRVQASLRKKISVDERARLVDSIASHVTTFTGSKRFTDARADPRAPLQRLLEHLDVPEAYDKEVEILTSRIAECPTDALQDNTRRCGGNRRRLQRSLRRLPQPHFTFRLDRRKNIGPAGALDPDQIGYRTAHGHRRYHRPAHGRAR